MPTVNPPAEPYSLEHIDDNWQAVDKATLLFVLCERDRHEPNRQKLDSHNLSFEKKNKVLLIRKKRGLGAGKINGPGGKLEAGETPQQCAHREVHEELCITVTESSHRGRLRFQFQDGYSIDVSVFVANSFIGTPTETDEAEPLWFELDAIPYDEMWEDDRIWLPRVLQGERVDGKFVFDSDRMESHSITFS